MTLPPSRSTLFPYTTLFRSAREETEKYFATRPLGSRLGAWASIQSSVISDRAELDRRVAEVETRFASGQVPAPPHWGGYRVDRKSTRLNSSHSQISYAVFCL